MSQVRHDGTAHRATVGRSIFDYADALAVEVATSCRRTGRCHECVVEVTRGMDALNPRSEAESFLRDPYRLACQAVLVADDVEVVFAPLRRRPRIVTVGAPRATLDRAPMVTRRGGDVFYGDALVDHYRGRILGLAVDLGTTTVVMDLVDLETGESVAAVAFENPQRFAGSDVMTRISYAGEAGQGELQQAVVTALNREIRNLARRHGIARREIYEIVIAGNTTMRDIFFGHDVQSIGQKPYKSLVEYEFAAGRRDSTALSVDAWSLGLRVNRRARAYSPPLIASHVGADTAACLAAIGLSEHTGEAVMLVDMGTNTEVVVAAGGRIAAASCPAGPAFEGGLVEYGMPAVAGAIESISVAGDGFSWQTIGDRPPDGLCGSGLIDLLAELRRHGMMTAKGVFAAGRKVFALPLVRERGIAFSRRDASNLGQAKAANYCGQFIVLRQLGIDPQAIDKLYLAGGFATYVDPRNAIDIGLLAPVPVERIDKVGNAAAAGARMVLLSAPERLRLEALVKKIEHVELEMTPDFFELFVDGCQFKPMPARFAAPVPRRRTG